MSAFEPFDYSEPETGFFKARQYLSYDEIDDLVHGFFGEHTHVQALRKQLDRNLDEQNAVPPRDYKGDNCPWDYLKDTPLLELEYKSIAVDWQNRNAHTLILAGSGAGKTTLFKHMIVKLLKENCCVVVMDSQSQLIEELASLQLDEHEVTWISPEHKLALNPFDAHDDDLKDETIVNNKISLLEFVVEHLIKAPMTPRQKTLFYHCCHLVFSIPGGNIETFKDVLKDPFEYANYIDELDETARNFFNAELRSSSGRGKKGSYDNTRDELSYRLDGLLKQPTFRRIFKTEENTFIFYEEMQESKLILLDTSIALLAENSPTLGRLFVAQALQACFQRVKNKTIDKPVYFFIDEAHEIFDEKLERMLLQASKANVGKVLATQDFSRATRAGITDTLVGSTATKIVSQVGTGDAKKLASRMKTASDFLSSRPQHAFAYASGDMEAVSIRADANPLTGLPKRNSLKKFRKEMEFHYGPEPDEPQEPKKQTSENSDPENEPKAEAEVAMSQNDDHDIEPADTL